LTVVEDRLVVREPVAVLVVPHVTSDVWIEAINHITTLTFELVNQGPSWSPVVTTPLVW